MSLFGAVDHEKDEQLVKAEKSRMQGKKDWSEIYWRPTPHAENVIRILPAKAGTDASYHLKISKHFVRHADRTEQFTCMNEVYGEACPACEEWKKLLKQSNEKSFSKEEKKKILDEAKRFRPQRVGYFNIIVRGKDKPDVMLYEAPMTVWSKVVHVVASQGRMADIFDVFKNDKGEIETPGRDIIVLYDPDQNPQHRYNAYPTERCPMGTPEEVLRWYEQITDLVPENVAPRVDIGVAQIKTTGSKEAREQLRDMQRQLWIAEQEKENEEEEKPAESVKKTEEKPSGQKKAEPKDEAPKDAKVKPTTPQGDSSDAVLAGMKDKLAKIQAKQKA